MSRRFGGVFLLICLALGLDLFLGRARYEATLRVMTVGTLRARGAASEFIVGFERPGRYLSLSELFHWDVVEEGAVAYPAAAVTTFVPGTTVTVAEAAAAQLPRRDRLASWLDRVVDDVGGQGAGGGRQAPVRPDVLRMGR